MKITIKADTTLKHISIWNGIFNLTKKELEVLSSLIDAEILTDTKSLGSVSNKKKAAKVLGIEDYNTLNNYIKRLKDKKALLLKDNKYILHTLLNNKTRDVQIIISK
jgi:hypothetical protein